MPNVTITHEEAKNLAYKKLAATGLSTEHAMKVAEILVHADLRNVNSHGVLRTEHYVDRIQAGGINEKANISFEKTGTVTGTVDGDDGIGHVIADAAMTNAIQLAKEHGVGMVTAAKSSHCGALSYFVEKAAKEKLIGIAMTHTDKIVVPFGGREAFMGTNPIAYGIPANENEPLILDMATSNVALGKVLQHKEEGKDIPIGWGVNANGESVTNPDDVVSLSPFGGPKGYGLSLIVDIFSGLLAGATFGPHITKMYGDMDRKRKLGHYFCAIDPAMFTDKQAFLQGIDQLMQELRESPTAPGFSQVFVPGDIEQINKRKNMEQGISIASTVYDYLTNQDD